MLVGTPGLSFGWETLPDFFTRAGNKSTVAPMSIFSVDTVISRGAQWLRQPSLSDRLIVFASSARTGGSRWMHPVMSIVLLTLRASNSTAVRSRPKVTHYQIKQHQEVIPRQPNIIIGVRAARMMAGSARNCLRNTE